ncbi:jacalin-related lectin 3-like isoform X2 [Magnolia sinica]|uniref:jacalin-related lectin 3-like isoform X2 n=1 Tax=Magnolia sinica TaxID=86752 RepID=UPI002657C447|nr:jacalin-related lectin 3-like isoform X2 [Magnolia sinica]
MRNGKSPIAVGPWGGQGGTKWDDGAYTTIRQLVVVHAVAIDSIQIEYDNKGSSVWSEKHGGSGGSRTDQIKLNFPDEYLISISGYYGSIFFGFPTIVRSLTFETNRTKYGPFGFQQGTPFIFPATGSKIVGFHGSSGWYLESIGFYLKPMDDPSPSNALIPSSRTLTVDRSATGKVGYSVVQGTVGKGYDIVLAVREREDSNSNSNSSKVTWNSLSRQSSQSSESDDEMPNKLATIPSFTEKGAPPVGGGPITYGPWGGNGGIIFDDGMYTGVRQINITRNAGITSIKVLYDRNGQAIWGSKHGGSGGIKSDKIVFDYPFEILTHITGYYGTTLIMGPTAIKSLMFHTTKRKYGPFGEESGTFFSSNIKDGMVVGFHGRNGWYIDSIGVHVLEGKVFVPPQPTPPTNSFGTPISEVDNPQWSNKLVVAKRGGPGEEVVYGVVKEPVPSGPGPWGGDGGRPWDDGVFSGVKQIFLTRGEAMTSIQIEYDRNGQSIWSTKHGAGGGEATHRIRFDYPNEVLNCISGYYCSINRDEGHKVIRSLTFFTSRGKYGPYGEDIGTFFTSTITEGKVVGFHGRSGLYLDAIGVHMQHWLGSEKRPSKSLISKFLG